MILFTKGGEIRVEVKTSVEPRQRELVDAVTSAWVRYLSATVEASGKRCIRERLRDTMTLATLALGASSAAMQAVSQRDGFEEEVWERFRGYYSASKRTSSGARRRTAARTRRRKAHLSDSA